MCRRDELVHASATTHARRDQPTNETSSGGRVVPERLPDRVKDSVALPSARAIGSSTHPRGRSPELAQGRLTTPRALSARTPPRGSRAQPSSAPVFGGRRARAYGAAGWGTPLVFVNQPDAGPAAAGGGSGGGDVTSRRAHDPPPPLILPVIPHADWPVPPSASRPRLKLVTTRAPGPPGPAAGGRRPVQCNEP